MSNDADPRRRESTRKGCPLTTVFSFYFLSLCYIVVFFSTYFFFFSFYLFNHYCHYYYHYYHYLMCFIMFFLYCSFLKSYLLSGFFLFYLILTLCICIFCISKRPCVIKGLGGTKHCNILWEGQVMCFCDFPVFSHTLP